MKDTDVTFLNLAKVFPNPGQPRKEFDPGKLAELAQSIRTYGVLTPIVATPRGEGYMIIAGERRYRASVLAEKKDIPARVIEADDALVEELSLLENVQREDLNPIEEAQAFRALLERGITKEELANRLGFKQVWRIDERLSLLNLAAGYQQLVVKGEIGNSQAFEMSRVSLEKQEVVLRQIKAGKLPTYNRLRAFVDGLIASENQVAIFELKFLSDEEKKTIAACESMVRSAERVLRAFHEEKRLSHLRKLVFHTDVSVERIDLIIEGLRKVRKEILAGAGAKEAAEAA